MEFILKILLICFAVFGVVIIAIRYYSTLKQRPVFQKTVQRNNDFSKPISVLENARSTPVVKAEAFISLMMFGYALVHLMGNRGKDYNNKSQIKRFQKCWSSQQLKKINSLDEGNREY